ncbi:MAG: tetratricopeptide repeat protein [Patescibacteria group bacterium]
MKESKKTTAKLEFPNIYRTITEKIHFKPSVKLSKFYAYASIVLTFIVVILLLGLMVFVSFEFGQNFTKYQNLHVQRQDLKSKINFWNSVAEKYDGYPDAYLNLANLYFQLNDFENAKKYVYKALLLNPDLDKALVLEEKLKRKDY